MEEESEVPGNHLEAAKLQGIKALPAEPALLGMPLARDACLGSCIKEQLQH